MGELDVAQEIRVNQYKNCFIYAYIFLPWLVVSIYSELSSGFIQPPPPSPSRANSCSYTSFGSHKHLLRENN